MTAQVGERLLYEGRELAMWSEPLESYFESGGTRPKFAFTWTALWRGYVGTWEITRGRLYLVGLRGTLIDESEASLATIFPENPRRVFAKWYSGTLRIPEGNLLKYVHSGFKTTYEYDRHIHVHEGIVTGTDLRNNRPFPG